jgi:uncharacterized protein YjbJ (UPF0337 family)
MDRKRIIGSGKQITGAIKVAIGTLVGDAKLKLAGEADKAEGKAQNSAGRREGHSDRRGRSTGEGPL